MNKDFMMIDGMPVTIDGEKNILSLIRKAGIDVPTFCYYSELSVYGACRMCVVEDERGEVMASCSSAPRAGMDIKTNTLKLQKHRKMILELLLSNHCRDCTTCEKLYKCKLQDIAQRLGLRDIRFPNRKEFPMVDDSSKSITRDKSKCILCGDCVRMCSEIQNVGAIDFAHRGADMEVTTAFDMPVAETNCVNCGQCSSVCPTGAIVVKNDTEKVWKDLYDENTLVVAQIAPAVRVALGDEFHLPAGENTMGKIVAALKRIGFDEVYDTATAADLTVVEEASEFIERYNNGGKLPLFTSCCPAWIKYVELNHKDLMPNISTCKSPMQMYGAVLKEHCKRNLQNGKAQKVKTVAVMPCTAKKYEATRDEFKIDGEDTTDYVITTQELAQMIRQSGIVFSEVEPEAVDMPFGIASGAGVLFGVTGGVTEAVVRHIVGEKTRKTLNAISFMGVRGFDGLKEATVEYGDTELKIAMVSGLANADALVRRIKSGEVHYDFVEVMACPGGCVCGAGQPNIVSNTKFKDERAYGIYQADKMSNIKLSEENPILTRLYDGLLKDDSHKLLHVHYE